MTSRPHDEAPATGGVHEETARLFAALEGAAAAWAGARGRDDVRDEQADAPPGDPVDSSGHLPATCGVCPVCLALDHVGRRHPEVLVHLGEAVRALGAAFTALTSEAGTGGGPDQAPPATDRDGDRPRTPPTERIDVED